MGFECLLEGGPPGRPVVHQPFDVVFNAPVFKNFKPIGHVHGQRGRSPLHLRVFHTGPPRPVYNEEEDTRMIRVDDRKRKDKKFHLHSRTHAPPRCAASILREHFKMTDTEATIWHLEIVEYDSEESCYGCWFWDTGLGVKLDEGDDDNWEQKMLAEVINSAGFELVQQQDDELSSIDIQRQRSIERNRAFLQELGL